MDGATDGVTSGAICSALFPLIAVEGIPGVLDAVDPLGRSGITLLDMALSLAGDCD